MWRVSWTGCVVCRPWRRRYDVSEIPETGGDDRGHARGQRLRSQLERRLGTLHRVGCQPQRVGQSSSVAVTAEGACGEVHLLLTVGGHESWPSEEEYRHPRWYIQVVDAADLFYLLVWLCDGGQEA